MMDCRSCGGWLTALTLRRHFGLNRIGGQIGSTLPFDKVAAVADLHKLGSIFQLFECLIAEIRPHIELADSAVRSGNHQSPVRLGIDFLRFSLIKSSNFKRLLTVNCKFSIRKKVILMNFNPSHNALVLVRRQAPDNREPSSIA